MKLLLALSLIVAVSQTDCFSREHAEECFARQRVTDYNFEWLMVQCWGPDGAQSDQCNAIAQQFAEDRTYLEQQCDQ